MLRLLSSNISSNAEHFENLFKFFHVGNIASDKYPFARVSVIFQLFSHHFVFTKLAASSTRVNYQQVQIF